MVRDDAKRRAALDGVAAAARELGFEVLGHAESPIEGPAGNREWLLALHLPAVGQTRDLPRTIVRRASARGARGPVVLDHLRMVCY